MALYLKIVLKKEPSFCNFGFQNMSITKKIEFKNSNEYLLSARLELPENNTPKAFAIFAHCFTCNKNLKAVINIAKSLTEKNFGVLRFDFTGLGQSEGDFSNTDFTSNVNDLKDVANYLSKHYEAPKLMIGHSLGGAASIFASGQIDSIKATATIGAPSSPGHVEHLFEGHLSEIKGKGEAKVNIGGRSFTISENFVKDIHEKKMDSALKSLNRPLLILHSPQDMVVGINNASEIYKNAQHPKSFISLDGADHMLSQEIDSLFAGNVIAEWAARYIF